MLEKVEVNLWHYPTQFSLMLKYFLIIPKTEQSTFLKYQSNYFSFNRLKQILAYIFNSHYSDWLIFLVSTVYANNFFLSCPIVSLKAKILRKIIGSKTGSAVKNLPVMLVSRDLVSTPESGRSPGEGNDNPLQYSCLGCPMDRRAWQSTAHGVQRVGYNWLNNNRKITGSNILEGSTDPPGKCSCAEV